MSHYSCSTEVWADLRRGPVTEVAKSHPGHSQLLY